MANGRVRWEDVDTATYERMVAVLLSLLHPDVVRIDGAGGDGGRDCFLPLDDGQEIFQLKSHTGRMGRAQRHQVKESLAAAATHHPIRWHLVVPIDPTPAEEEWFRSLQNDYVFPLAWHGKTWLDARMAERPYVRDYFLRGTADEVLDALRELGSEHAALDGGAPQAVARVAAVVDRLNTLDPFYEFAISVASGHRTVEIRPRYEGAERDRPIRVSVHGQFPADPEGEAAAEAFREALDFGLAVHLDPRFVASVEIDAPAQLGGVFHATEVSLLPIEGPPTIASLQLRVMDPGGAVLAELPVRVSSQNTGLAGVVLTATDATTWLTLVIRAHFVDRRLDVTLRTELHGSVAPAALLPALAFMSVFHRPNTLTIVTNDAAALEVASGLLLDIASTVDTEQNRLIADLSLLQQKTNVYFDVPVPLTHRDLREINEGVRLLSGESVALPWESVTLTLTPAADEPTVLLEAAREGLRRSLITETEVSVEVAGHVMRLGRGRVIYPEVAVANPEDVIADWYSGEPVLVKLGCLKPPLMQLLP